eukprot:TRINITY_DN15812_c0_g1_i1.p1 TRINITY_DN15812_c0_g1~~TRINITY_DN15812_c0_g1_i1.p1  ORF type:complete len:333 (+),score=51.44 TRINITY_DN15812_c0_g1_i1:90-1088(+)
MEKNQSLTTTFKYVQNQKKRESTIHQLQFLAVPLPLSLTPGKFFPESFREEVSARGFSDRKRTSEIYGCEDNSGNKRLKEYHVGNRAENDVGKHVNDLDKILNAPGESFVFPPLDETWFVWDASDNSKDREESSSQDSNQTFQCPIDSCQKIFTSKRNLKQHTKYHYERAFKCTLPECSRAFVRKSDLKKHEAVHSPDRPYLCDFPGCNKSFKQKGNLKKHSEVHSSERPFSCSHPGCSKSFKSKATLKTHAKIHSTDRPFKCPFSGCDKAFKRNFCLKSHLKYIHSSERPFKCTFPGCDKAFKESGGLKKHALVHSDPMIASKLSSQPIEI